MDVSEEFREVLGDEVLALVGGRVRKRGREKTYITYNSEDAVKEYILDRLRVQKGGADPRVKVIVNTVDAGARAEFEVVGPNGSRKSYHQASIVIGGGA